MKILNDIKEILSLVNKNKELLIEIETKTLKEEISKLKLDIDKLEIIKKSNIKYNSCVEQATQNIISDINIRYNLTQEINRLLSIFPKENNWTNEKIK